MKATTLVYTAIAGIVLYLFYKKRPKIEQATAEDKGGGSTGGALGGFKPSKEVKPIDTQLGGFNVSDVMHPLIHPSAMHPLIRSSIDTQLGLSTPIGVVISPVEAMPVKIRLDDSLAVTNNY